MLPSGESRIARTPTSSGYTAVGRTNTITPTNLASPITNTNAELLRLNIYEDEDMEEVEVEEEVEIVEIIGGRETIINSLYGVVTKLMAEPMEEFRRRFADTLIDKQIKKAKAPSALSDAAARIAAVVGNERAAPRPLLQGLINNSVDNSQAIKDLQKELQSTKAKYENEVKKNKKKKNGPPPATAKNGKGGSNYKRAATATNSQGATRKKKATADASTGVQPSKSDKKKRGQPSSKSSEKGKGSRANKRS